MSDDYLYSSKRVRRAFGTDWDFIQNIADLIITVRNGIVIIALVSWMAFDALQSLPGHHP
jgi:hypothetical protein